MPNEQRRLAVPGCTTTTRTILRGRMRSATWLSQAGCRAQGISHSSENGGLSDFVPPSLDYVTYVTGTNVRPALELAVKAGEVRLMHSAIDI